jgi:hypothetical protein
MSVDPALTAALRRDLRAVAAMGATLSYAQVADAQAVQPPGRIRQVTLALEALMAEDATAGRPFLAAVVVGRRDGLPREGFFDAATRLGRLDGALPQAEFHARERRALAAWFGR